MAYLSPDELAGLGLKRCGTDVKISAKASIYHADRIEIGDHVRIDDFCILSGTVSIGRNVHVAVFCHVAGGRAGIVLDDFSGLAAGCHVFTETDDYTGQAMTNPTVPEAFTRLTRQPVVLGRHAIIGIQSAVFPGVTVAEGTSVGAMSLVTRSTEPWSIYAGIPARKIRDRSRALLDKERAYLGSGQVSAGD